MRSGCPHSRQIIAIALMLAYCVFSSLAIGAEVDAKPAQITILYDAFGKECR